MVPETRSSDAPEARSSDARRRFNPHSTTNVSRQLTLLCTLSTIAMLPSPTVTAIEGPQASFTPHTTRIAAILSHSGFQELATAAPSLSDSTSPPTIFVPGRCLTPMSDSIIGHSSTAVADLEEALDIAVFKNAIFSIMKKISISPSMAYSPPTLLIRRYLNETQRPHFISVGGVNVTLLDHVAVHGLNGIISLRSSEATRAVSGSPRSGLCSSVIDPVIAPLLCDSMSSFSSFLTELGTSFIISVILMLLFAKLSAKHGNDVVYYPNRILKGMTQCQGSSKTQNLFSWIKEVLSSSEQNVITMSCVASAVYFVFLSIVLGVLVLSGLMLLPVLLPIAATDNGVTVNTLASTSHGTFNQLEKFHMVPNRYLTFTDRKQLLVKTTLPTLEQGQTLIPTSSGGLTSAPLRINYVRIKIVVHSPYLPIPHIRSMAATYNSRLGGHRVAPASTYLMMGGTCAAMDLNGNYSDVLIPPVPMGSTALLSKPCRRASSVQSKIREIFMLTLSSTMTEGVIAKYHNFDLRSTVRITSSKSNVAKAAEPAPVALTPSNAAVPAASTASLPPVPGSTVVPFTSIHAAVSKNMVESLTVHLFQVGYPVKTDTLDALYEEVKPQGVIRTAILARAIFLGKGLVAIVSGLFGNALVDALSLGPVTPFVVAACFLAIGMAILLSSWSKNYGDAYKNKDLPTHFRGAAVAITSAEKIALLAATQSLFQAMEWLCIQAMTPSWVCVGVSQNHSSLQSMP